jgi:hypothetical protein
MCITPEAQAVKKGHIDLIILFDPDKVILKSNFFSFFSFF